MPRRTRRDAEQSAAMESAASTEPPSTINSADQSNSASHTPTNSSETPDAQSQAKPRARRSRRTTAGETTAAAETVVSSAQDSSVPDQPPSAEAPKARRPRSNSRRNKAAESLQADDQSSTVQAESAPVESQGAAQSTTSDAAPTGTRRRRPGGRRTPGASPSAPQDSSNAGGQDTSAPIPGLDTPPPAPAEEGEDASSTTRSRRSRRGGRRRRGGKDQIAGVEGAEQGESAEADTADQPAEIAAVEGAGTAPEGDEDGGRSRRSRRGGRRRKGSEGVEAGQGAETTTVPAEEKYELSLPALRARDRWTAPRLVPAPADIGLAPVDLGIEAGIDTRSPAFVINGQRHAAHLFFVNADTSLLEEGGDPEAIARQIRRAAAAGIHLHTCVIYLPLKNAYGERGFAAIDAAIKIILDADTEGYLVLRVQCVPTNFWARTHEDQMVKYHDGSAGDVTIASAAFWSDCVDALAALLARLAQPETPGHGRVFALHLDKGEWFYEPGAGYDYSPANIESFRAWLHENYQSEHAIRAAWYDGRVTFESAEIPPYEASKEKRGDTVLYDRKRDRRYVDYVTYASSVVGSVLCGLATAVKEITQGKLLVFTPYGYLFEFATRNDSGHQALGQLLRCADVDVLTGPNSYISRAPGGVGGFATPVDSVRLHDKLWIVEDDTKTYLAQDDTPDTYNPKINGQQETVMVQRRNFYAALAHGSGLSWMDLWGQGWLDSDSLWEEITQMLESSRRLHAADASVESVPEAAVLVDEASFSWVRNDAGGYQLQSGLIIKARDLLLRSGASVGFYLQSDVALLPESVKAVFFLNALRVTTDERQAIREKLQRAGKTLVWIYAPGLFDENGVAPSEVTEIVGMPLKAQPWNARIGTVFTDERHPITERLHGGKRMGTEDVVNPSFTVIDPQATVLGEYAQTGDPSVVVKVAEGGWKSVFVGEPHLTGELIRGILRYGGVHLYDVQDDIVYARGDGLLVLHSPYTGQRAIHLPNPAACYSLSEQRLVSQNSSSVRLFMRGRSTHVLLWGDLETIARRTGISEVDLLESLNNRPDRPDREGGRGRRDDVSGDEMREYAHDRDYTEGDDRQEGQHGLGIVDQGLEEVLKAVVEEVYSHPAEESTGEVLDARLEASRITEALLSDLSGDMAIEGQLPGSGEIDLFVDEDAAEGGEPGEAAGDGDQGAGGARRSSSRRRRWRRKQQGSGTQPAEASTPISVDDIIGDLVARRKPQEPGNEQSSS